MSDVSGNDHESPSSGRVTAQRRLCHRYKLKFSSILGGVVVVVGVGGGVV